MTLWLSEAKRSLARPSAKMVPGHAGEGEKQQINAITRNIHIGVHDMGTIF